MNKCVLEVTRVTRNGLISRNSILFHVTFWTSQIIRSREKSHLAYPLLESLELQNGLRGALLYLKVI